MLSRGEGGIKERGGEVEVEGLSAEGYVVMTTWFFYLEWITNVQCFKYTNSILVVHISDSIHLLLALFVQTSM